MNQLAEIAKAEALKCYHGAVMGAASNLDEIIAPFTRWKKDEAERLWCAAFVLHCCKKSGMDIPIRPKECVTCNLAGCGAWEEWAQTDERIEFHAQSEEYEPMPGDIALFNRVFCDAEHDHIGVVVDVASDKLTVAEGNFNNVSCLVTRQRDEHIRAYIKIPDGFIY